MSFSFFFDECLFFFDELKFQRIKTYICARYKIILIPVLVISSIKGSPSNTAGFAIRQSDNLAIVNFQMFGISPLQGFTVVVFPIRRAFPYAIECKACSLNLTAVV
jgi:hypothetical protein